MELLAPAGGWDALVAAIENGADAVYIGGQSFSARQSAENFNDEQIKTASDYAHMHDKKVYLTVNTLIDNNEFAEALDYIFKANNNGIDAIIVQDLGLMDAVRSIMPEIRLHASTQMTVHNPEGVKYLQEQGIKRIVLARELSLDDLQAIHRDTGDIELEIFVHGALCYCYSGQCLFSSVVGGRSGNRGRCAQPCRLGYDLYIANHGKVELEGHGRYLLSPADLCLLDYLAQLEAAGITSLKIEGRMKRPEYVATVTRIYREVLDSMKNDPLYKPAPQFKNDLLKIFNRNFSSGYLYSESENFLSTRRPNNRGVYIGRVIEQNRDLAAKIKLNDTVNLGDGLDIWVKKGKGPAFVVREMFINGNKVTEAGKGDIITVKLEGSVFPGDRVFKTHDEKLLMRACESIKPENRKKIPVDVKVILKSGEPMRLIFCTDDGNVAEVSSSTPAEPAVKHALNEITLRDKLERMGNTPFMLRAIRMDCEEELMVPFSEINEARRMGVEHLIQNKLSRKAPAKLTSADFIKKKDQFLSDLPAGINHQTLLSIAVSSYNQALSALNAGAERVYIGLEGMGNHKRITQKEIKHLLDYGAEKGRQIIPIVPRIQKPTDFEVMKNLMDTGMRWVMVGNPGAVKWTLEHGIAAVADYTLNIFNQYSLNFLGKSGIRGACLSPELNFKQLQGFKNFAKVELLVHGELILMVSQYCMLSGVLGKNHTKCAGYCTKGHYYIKDDRGYEFPLATDADCRFYVFNSRTLCMIDDLERILKLGPESIRIEARKTDEQDIYKIVKTYRQALDSLLAGQKTDLEHYKEQLERTNGSPFTKCHYYRGVL